MMTTERDISLEEAVLKAKPVRFATWITSGNILENTILSNMGISRISVSWTVRKIGFSVTLAITEPGEDNSYTDLGSFSNLKELKESFPEFFEVTGTLRVR